MHIAPTGSAPPAPPGLHSPSRSHLVDSNCPRSLLPLLLASRPAGRLCPRSSRLRRLATGGAGRTRCRPALAKWARRRHPSLAACQPIVAVAHLHAGVALGDAVRQVGPSVMRTIALLPHINVARIRPLIRRMSPRVHHRRWSPRARAPAGLLNQDGTRAGRIKIQATSADLDVLLEVGDCLIFGVPGPA